MQAPTSSSTWPQRPAGVRFSSQAVKSGIGDQRRVQRRVEIAGGDGVALQAVARPVRGHSLGQVGDGALGRGVGRDPRAGERGLDPGDVDDLAGARARSCAGATAWPTLKTEEMLVWSMRSKASAGKSSSGARCCMPALLTRMSMGPVSASKPSTAARTAAWSVASKGSSATVAPAPRRAAAAAASLPASRPLSTTAAPALASPSASASRCPGTSRSQARACP